MPESPDVQVSNPSQSGLWDSMRATGHPCTHPLVRKATVRGTFDQVTVRWYCTSCDEELGRESAA